jgi:hypothetical protein
MDKLGEKHLEKLLNLVDNLFKDQRETAKFMRFSDFFDEVFFPFASYVSPYLWIIPLIPTIIIIVTFKRAKLFGVTQKFIFMVMVIDMFFTLFTGIKDVLLNFLGMNYGFVEYEICRILLISFRVQEVLHGSSLLLKSIMTARIVGLFAFPIKFRNFRLKKWMALLVLIHVSVCAYYFFLAMMTPIFPVTTVQVYRHGQPLKIIQACVLDIDHDNFRFSDSYTEIMFVVHIVYFLLIPVLLQCVLLVALLLLLKKHIKAVENLVHDNRQRSVVKYLRLMKISIFMGISFLIQEVPLVVTLSYGFSDDLRSLTRMTSMSYVLMAISYAIGKPVDLLIYSYQSETFKKTLSKWLCRIKKVKDVVIDG